MNIDKAVEFIWANARLLDRVIFEHRFLGGSPGRILDVLRAYQNPDGGFGHALEMDLRAPDSHPLYVEFALWTLYDCRLRDQRMALNACDFLARHSSLEAGIPTLFPSFSLYPHAPHWRSPAALQPSLDRLIGLVGLASWQGVDHPWLRQAAAACLEKVASLPFDDAHSILAAFTLLESFSPQRGVETLFHKLAEDLISSRFFLAGAPVTTYGLTPLEFAPTPQSFCRRLFSGAQIDAHLDDLASRQEGDGAWPILWDPPSEAARCEWRAHVTVKNLSVLKAYGRAP